jgi:hypothetical protein
VAVDDDQRRAVLLGAEALECLRYEGEVVGIADAQDVPVVSEEAGGDIVRVRDLGAPVDRDVVVVVGPAEVG